jgi:hypothetical protein
MSTQDCRKDVFVLSARNRYGEETMPSDTFTQYPHVDNLEADSPVFNLPQVVITEKIHGSSMRLGVIDGVLRIGGRRLEFTDIRPDTKEGLGFVSWVLDQGLDTRCVQAFTGHNVILYGEWHGSGTPSKGWPQIQKGIRYLGGNDFRIFDIKIDGHYIDQEQLAAWANKVDLHTMPVLYRGEPSQAQFDALIDTISRLGQEHGIDDPGNTLEGLIIRPPTMQWDARGNPVMAKYKIGKWAERASAQRHPKTPKKKRAPACAAAQEFVADFVIDTRLDHVLDQLRQEGIAITHQTLGEILKRMGQDVKREGAKALDHAGLEWKDVSPLVTTATKKLYLAYLRSCTAERCGHPETA